MLRAGMTGRISKVVAQGMCAVAVGSGELPVLATPVLAALVEEAAWRSISSGLDEGQTTVGTKLELNHTKATPQGMAVTVETGLQEVDRRRLVFRFVATDEAGEVASGTHERFVVDAARFMERAQSAR